MIFKYTVNHNGIIYPPGVDVPIEPVEETIEADNEPKSVISDEEEPVIEKAAKKRGRPKK
jgi:hypothetical protein